MNELHLFAGAGGGILAGQMLGHRCVCAVEWEPYAAAVLAQRQNDGLLPPFPIWDDVRTFDGRAWRGIVDIVAGGFPCQDISVAGKGAGITGARSGMWGHMVRIVGKVRPRFVFVENSPALLTRGLGVVLSDLAALGYDCRWTVLGAADVGAPHQRDRFWLVGSLSNAGGQIGLGYMARKNAWSTPLANSHTGAGHGPNKTGAPNLQTMVSMWPTPTVCGNYNRKGASPTSGDGLATAVLKVATPTARDWRSGKASQATHDKNSRPLSEQIGGSLNPTWVEWLMGWPLGWTDLKPLATDKSHCALPQHSECLQQVFEVTA